eukprot:NODE_67_length_23829_cov_0.557059.p3 type:complete len:456 gc:universal NODE_67_length_23829_cov_0.557059:2325-3692(+)
MQHQLIDAKHSYHPAVFENKPYSLLSIVGSQSSGKSTLLNEMFNLQFDVMQATRKQTTKGVVLDKYMNDEKQVIVCDVEGSDGREHGEEQKTERLLLLFALSVSDILLFNLFENSVGLYHGANMGLMRMVLEIYYEIFIEHHQNEKIKKKTLLFVVRDYTNTTPVEEMRNILYNDIATIWSNLTDKNVDLYFDVNIHALPHFKLQKLEFQDSVKSLKNNIISLQYKDELRVHSDSLNDYMSRIWELITTNKELDVPTQMELVMKYRVQRLGQECLDSFQINVQQLKAPSSFDVNNMNHFIMKSDELANKAFCDFKSITKRVSIDISDVYLNIKQELHLKILEHLNLSTWFTKMVSETEGCSTVQDLIKSVDTIKMAYDALIPVTSVLDARHVYSKFNDALKKASHAAHSLILDDMDLNKDWRFILKLNVQDEFNSSLNKTWDAYKSNLFDSGILD